MENSQKSDDSGSPKRPSRKRKKPDRLGIQTRRSNNDRTIDFDSESEIELPENNSSEPISTDKLLESSEDENKNEPEPENYFTFPGWRRGNKDEIVIKANHDAYCMSKKKNIYYREFLPDTLNNKYFNVLQDRGPIPNEIDISLKLTASELIDRMLILKKDDEIRLRKYDGLLIEECGN